MKKCNRIFAIYKGDNFIDLGTAEQLAQKLKIKKKSIYWLASTVAHKRDKGNNTIAILVDNEVED